MIRAASSVSRKDTMVLKIKSESTSAINLNFSFNRFFDQLFLQVNPVFKVKKKFRCDNLSLIS